MYILKLLTGIAKLCCTNVLLICTYGTSRLIKTTYFLEFLPLLGISLITTKNYYHHYFIIFMYGKWKTSRL